MNTKILASLLIIGLVASTVGLGTYAYFSDTETSTGNIMQAGRLDLKIADCYDGGGNYMEDCTAPGVYTDPYDGFLVKLEDLKPSQEHFVTKWFRIVDNPAKVYLHITDIVCDQGTQSEPEIEEEEQNGVQWNIDDYVTYDLIVIVDGEVVMVIHPGEHIKLGELESLWIYLGTFDPLVDIKVIQSFHLQAEVTNWAQGDACTFTEEFIAYQTNAEDPPNVKKVIKLENKDGNWNVIEDDLYGYFDYWVNDAQLHGRVWATGLTPNAYHQISLNAPGTCQGQDSALASDLYQTPTGTAPPTGFNLYERGYWDGVGPYLAATCSGPGEGIYNTVMFAQADAAGDLTASFDVDLPSGTYSGIKVLVKEAIGASPPDNYGTSWPVQLMETATANFVMP